MALSPLTIHDLTEALLACVCVALDRTAEEVDGQPGCPSCRTCVVPGQVAFDECFDPCNGDAGGQLSVSVAQMYPSSPDAFPALAQVVQGVRGCMPPPMTAVELVVTLLRCAPLPTDQGCPPACDELAASARILHVDMATIANAVLCCLPGTSTARRGPRFVLGQQRVIGPEGGCVGVEQRVTVAVPGCGCPPEEEG